MYIREVKHPKYDLYLRKYTKKAFYKKHWTEETLNARGHVVDSAGVLVARPFRKIFNVGEHPSASYEEFRRRVARGSLTCDVKFNGHLAILFNYCGEWINTTSGSFEHDFIARDRELIEEAADLERLNPAFTYMFEIIGLHDIHLLTHRHIEDLGGECAVGIGQIHTESGVSLKLERSRFMPPDLAKDDDLFDNLLEPKRVEGWVFTDIVDGWQAKIKTHWYFQQRYVYNIAKTKFPELKEEYGYSERALEELPEELYKLYEEYCNVGDTAWSTVHAKILSF